ncbi:MAG: response regulator transcription factor [Phycisphaerales bacterium]|nr:response regulator transcription factor [Phycisphaerales bacterium]
MNQIGQIERIRDVVADAKSRLGVHHRVMSEAERIDRERMSLLTDREREIMALTAEGRTVKEIAAQLGRSVSTIETHRENIMRKVGLHDRVALTRLAIRTGLISA